jgi:hypothetical protein
VKWRMAASSAADNQPHIMRRNRDWQLCQIHAVRV